MNLYLLEMFLKFLRMIFVAFVSLFNITLYAEDVEVKENSIMNANSYAVNRVVIKETTPVVNNKVTANKVVNNVSTNKTTINKNNVTNKPVTSNKNVVVSKPVTTNKTPVVNNQTTTNNNTTTNKVTTTPPATPNKVITSEVTDVPLAQYTGRLTGYGPDCVGCSKVGNVACRTREKKAHSLINDGIYYTDKEYGKVRILAAATSKFKCGTIVVVTKPGMQPFTGIVLDTGGSMRQAWAKGNVWMDLAYSSNAMAGSDKLTGKNIKFSVQRWGW